jgi:adenylate cyclase
MQVTPRAAEPAKHFTIFGSVRCSRRVGIVPGALVSRSISFGRFEVRLEERLLLVDQMPAAIGSRAFDVLVALLERRDRVVTKGELLDIVWPGLVVEENNLSVQISALRKILGAPAIATVTGRGYRFAMPSVEVRGLVAPQAGAAGTSGRVQRRLAALACAEVAGWPAAVARDGERAVHAWRAARAELIEPHMAEFGAQLIELSAENLVAEFASAVDAVRWAADLQQRLGEPGRHVLLKMRIGIGVEDLIVDDGKLFGDGVQSARALLDVALADQIVVSAGVRRFAEGKLPVRFRRLERPGGADGEELFVVEPLPVGEGADDSRRLAWDSRPTVAVLPFAVEGGDAADYFGDGMTEEIITALSVNRALFVIARSSTLRYRGSTGAPTQIAAELGVRYLLTGTLRRRNGRLRLNAELVDASANRIIWAERFEGADEDLFGFQAQIAASIAAAIDPRVQEAEIARVSGRPTGSLSAYDCVLRGLSVLYSFRGDDFALAGQMFRRAIELDPAYAQAHAHLAWWHNLRFGEGRSTEISEDHRQAEVLSLRAVELDARDAVVLAVAAHIQSVVRKRFTVAMGMFEQALAINPNSALAWARSATTLAYMGRGEEALQRVRHAMRLSPFDPMSFAFCTTNGTAAIVAGRYDEAASWLSKARRLNPGYRAATRMLIAALALCGERAEARELAQEFMADEPGFRVSSFAAWYPLCQPHLDRVLEGMRLGGLPD